VKVLATPKGDAREGGKSKYAALNYQKGGGVTGKRKAQGKGTRVPFKLSTGRLEGKRETRPTRRVGKYLCERKQGVKGLLPGPGVGEGELTTPGNQLQRPNSRKPEGAQLRGEEVSFETGTRRR